MDNEDHSLRHFNPANPNESFWRQKNNGVLMKAKATFLERHALMSTALAKAAIIAMAKSSY